MTRHTSLASRTSRQWMVLTAMVIVCAGLFANVGSASAFSKEYSKFNGCQTSNPETTYCLQSLTTSGSVVVGNQNTPIVNTVTLQGSYNFNEETEKETFIGASAGYETLSKTPQPVPGGLLGIKCSELTTFLGIRAACEYVFEHGLTGVKATLELAKPAKDIQINTSNLLNGKGLALQLPIKLHLENTFLGGECYIGSEAAPIYWNLTTGTTSPPKGYSPLTGSPGTDGLIEGEIAVASGAKLVDNTWAAPGVSGCGAIPFSEYLIDPVIESKLALPAKAGVSSATLNNNVAQAYIGAVLAHP